ncbi:hypothetical protein CEUSTIGMA_g4439.t1 [Chlamydomonas eustigma]|uniref:FAD-binding FR-type domain-containing protein n=1 Tax=Chlamydomonas eustigma TaxID=1157962 RepID=A0A250X271_9CHLO|nr:hypothetical protein CEUSTIGMA_g4439.t1 [Chlamydomonas eustigma]|eukprot:GAX76992.1 hypothetical protein CEUSTIGMA_g4439.t1 [Chlamydomonas eustigma]
MIPVGFLKKAQLEVPTSQAPSWLKWAALGAAPVVAAYLLRTRGKKDDYETDFDSFLVTKGSTPTGVVTSKKGPESGPFEGFLKDSDEDQRDPAVFSTFLKSSHVNTKVAAPDVAHSAQLTAQKERPDPSMVKILVLYGTEYGFSKEIAERLASSLKETKQYWPTVVDMATRPEGYDFSKEQAALVACSTQGDGVPPTEARDFCEWLFAGKAGDLSHLHYSVCALGDKSYTHFCKCGISIDESFSKSGAKRVAARQDVNKEDWRAVNEWIKTVLTGLPSLGLKTIEQLGGMIDELSSSVDSAPAVKRWGKSRPYPAKVTALEGLCAVTNAEDKNTFRVEFDLGDSGLAYLPGDALGIYPTNPIKVVDELLSVSGLTGSCIVPVPNHHYEEPGMEDRPLKMTLTEALMKCYDLRSPKPDMLTMLASLKGQSHETLAKLKVLQEDNKALEAYLAPRHVADVLKELVPAPAVAVLTATELLAVLRPLQPRLYSISSSPLENPKAVQATIAEVKYQSLGSDRIGVCSTYVSERIALGDTALVFMSKNPDFRLPQDRSRPIIMVGPGTGLAPFRSFIKQRLLEDSSKGGQMVLLFGCRRSDQDYLYGSQLEAWSQSGSITLLTAFSRQQAEKVYVQQRLRENADLVWRLLHEEHGHFYVCGDASSMAGAVEAELLKIFQSKLGEDASAADEYLKKISQEERYQRDVWY